MGGESAPRVTASIAGPTKGRLPDYRHHERHPTVKYAATIRTGAARFHLQQWVDVDPSHQPKVLPLEGMIGMTAPAIANWYGNGFMNIHVGQDYVGDVPVHSASAAEQGERGVVQIEWRRPEGAWRVKFVALPNGRSLFCSVRCFPAKRHVDWHVRLVSYPGRTVHDGERAITTAKRAVKQIARATLAPQDEYWLACYDNVYDFGRGGSEGGGALVYAPEDVKSCEVQVTSYPVTIWLHPQGNEVRMILWDSFYGQSNAEIIDDLKRTSPEQLRALRATRFVHRAATSNEWQGYAREIEKLLIALGSPKEEGEVARRLRKTLSELSSRLAGVPSQEKVDDEPSFLQALKDQEKLLWRLRWEELFRD